jgi:mannose-1-phosphate guanylyltransferase
VPPERILVITGEAFADRTRALLPHIPHECILAEPRPASTGPALTWATHVAAARDPGATVLSMHADWHVGDDDAFRTTAEYALEVADAHDVLVTVGVVPTRPETGYGYIEPGAQLDGEARRVARFVEKPDAAAATALIERGALWNSGLFAWTAQRFLAECDAHAPEIAEHISALDSNDVAAFFSAVTPIAVDHSHFERSDRVAVVPGAFPWDDMGTWAALTRVRELDSHRNVVVGSAIARDTTNSVIWGEDGPVVVDGLTGIVVVRANGVTLVTTRERAADLKTLLATLSPDLTDPS